MGDFAQLLKILLAEKAPSIMLISSAALLVLPQPAIKFLGIAQLANNHRHIIGMAFIISLACTLHKPLVIGLVAANKLIHSLYTKAKQKRLLHALTADEHEILAAMAQAKLGKIALNSADEAVCSLTHKGILIPGNYQMSEFLATRYYTLAPWALAYMRAHREFLN